MSLLIYHEYPHFIITYDHHHLRNIGQSSAKNWEFGNMPSMLVSDNKQVSVSLRIRSLKLENLFLIEFMLRYPIITYLV